MIKEAGTITTRNCCRSISLCQPRKFALPVDYYLEMPIDRLPTGARAAYLVEAENPESVRRLGHGRHPVSGGRQIVALESGDRFFLAPVNNCVLEFSARGARLVDTGPGGASVTVGAKKSLLKTIVTSPEPDELFRALSFITSLPGETSPYRSHPLFRSHPPDIRLSPADHPRS
jgi:hypothetical protein